MLATRLSRREAGKLVFAAIALSAVGGHTPYAQWTVYRQRNLFIVASRTDPHAVLLADAVAAGLARELPESYARMTRASDPVRIASLLATGQLDVGIISRDDAAGIVSGSGVYRAVGPVPLRLLAELGSHLLVAVESFKMRHAFLLAGAVEHLRGSLPVVDKADHASHSLSVPEHPGAAAYRAGSPLPDVPAR